MQAVAEVFASHRMIKPVQLLRVCVCVYVQAISVDVWRDLHWDVFSTVEHNVEQESDEVCVCV